MGSSAIFADLAIAGGAFVASALLTPFPGAGSVLAPLYGSSGLVALAILPVLLLGSIATGGAM